jgi:putative hydrolase of the HAD superfamily
MSHSAHKLATVFVDADNTLWDTDLVFANAQRNILENVENAIGNQAKTDDRLAYVRMLDQALAERHHAGLRYPPRLLVRALEAVLNGTPVERAARDAWQDSTVGRLSDACVNEIERRFFDELGQTPQVRPGVREGLEVLRAANCFVLVVTEGHRAKVEKTLKTLHLDALINRVIEGRKRPELYQRIRRLTDEYSDAFMVGDQLDRDIAPAKSAGLETIYFPGGFRPRWVPPDGVIKPDHLIESFAEVSSIVLSDTSKHQPAPG